MRVEQAVTFTWVVNAEEDAVLCEALRASSDGRAAHLLAQREGRPLPFTSQFASQIVSSKSRLPDVDLLADQEPG